MFILHGLILNLVIFILLPYQFNIDSYDYTIFPTHDVGNTSCLSSVLTARVYRLCLPTLCWVR